MSEPACPKCGDTKYGYEFTMNVDHIMIGEWGGEAECGDSQRTKESYVKCNKCHAKFRYSSLREKGLITL